MSPTKPKKKRQSDGSANTRRRRLNPHFRFLDLPAELRNRVYEYYATDPPTPLWDESVLNIWELVDYIELQKYRLCLTQVCKQIRVECRPLCLTRFDRQIELRELDKYFAAFHDSSGSTVADKINVNLRDGSTSKVAGVDLLPIFKRFTQGGNATNVVCTFDHNVYLADRRPLKGLIDLAKVLTRCLEHARNPTWYVTAGKLHSMIPRSKDKRVVLNVKNYFKFKGSGRKSFEADLVGGLGLRNEGRWKVLIKYI